MVLSILIISLIVSIISIIISTASVIASKTNIIGRIISIRIVSILNNRHCL